MAVPQGFRPSLSPAQVRDYRRLYDQQPDKFNDQIVEALEHHAEYYNLPFAESNSSFMGKVGSVMKQAGQGFAEGWSTFEVGEPPRDDAEAIARNIGHLAGFVGYVPTFKGTGMIASAARAMKGRSVPMYIAGKATEKVSKISNQVLGKAIVARAGAAKTANSFLNGNRHSAHP